MNTDNFLKYEERGKMMNDVVESINKALNAVLEKEDRANILLSGGGTPGPIYQKLSTSFSALNQVKIGLVDDRFVPTNDKFSNELLLKNCFSSSKEAIANISGMVIDQTNKALNLELVNKAYSSFIHHTDIVVLGMGIDGHTASIFPNDDESDQLRQSQIKGVFYTNAPSYPTQRITCSPELILNATDIYLVISGEQKLEILDQSYRKLPIHDFLSKRKDIKIYYSSI